MKNSALIIFLKYPSEGYVKTRLAKVIGNKAAYELYKCFIEDLFFKVRMLIDKFSIYICYQKDNDEEFGNDFLIEDFIYFEQSGINLGDKMFNAFSYVFNDTCKSAVLIGSDIPHIRSDNIEIGFKRLMSNDIVIGPSFDGGYYLIGINKDKLDKTIFQNIIWSTPNVLNDTLFKIKKLNLTYFLLEKMFDLDEYSDLKRLLDSHENSSNTIKYIKKNLIY